MVIMMMAMMLVMIQMATMVVVMMTMLMGVESRGSLRLRRGCRECCRCRLQEAVRVRMGVGCGGGQLLMLLT